MGQELIFVNKKAAGCVLLTLLLSGCSNMTDLPTYVVINDPASHNKDVLRQPAETITFPLSAENKNIIAILGKKFDEEDNCAGLAAPQIGFNKRIIILAVKDDPELKKWRPDLSDTMPRTIWVNPTYKPVGKEKQGDYEACFSVDDLAGPVERLYRLYTGRPIR
jgi:peptide deformylase